jgi:predicted GH43/DUF377 family glycosyl hydrolase
MRLSAIVRCVGYPLKGASLTVRRQALRLTPDPRRVLARPFIVGGAERLSAIIGRVRALSDVEARTALAEVTEDFRARHKDIVATFRQSFATAIARLPEAPDVSEERALLMGAYFTQEYSLESAALFNPSMVVHPDQSGVEAGATRFVMSLRACGEGHISSIEFRSGIVDARHAVHMDPHSSFAVGGRPVDDALYDKATYTLKLREMKAHNAMAEQILGGLGAEFTMTQLHAAIARSRAVQSPPLTLFDETADNLRWLAHSNYHLDFTPDVELSERVVFPVSENESRGIEDARFVRFAYPDGRVVYYATYSAYNGFRVLPHLIETTDFQYFKINTLNGRCVQNKGMALFPRKLGDDFVMAARLDGENIFLLRSPNIHFWNESALMHRPKQPWEFVQLGNCGSPIETAEGWLLLTHGVGPMRQYSIGALLLDLEDPSRVIGELRDPLIEPNADERDGYVPNVVYSCGPMQHGDELVIPFAVSDAHTTFATVSIPALVAELKRHAPSKRA